MLFISSEKFFSFLRCLNFCISVFPSFFSVRYCFRGWLEINLEVYGIINCVTFHLISWEGKRYDIETLSIDRVLNKEVFFMGKSCGVCALKSSPRPFIFNYWFFVIYYQELCFFLSNPVPFNEQDYEKQKGHGTSDQSLFSLQNNFRKIPLLVAYYWTKFGDVI